MRDLLDLVDELRLVVEPATPKTIPEGAITDRWLLRSALQKAIRRGQTLIAGEVAGRLLSLDPAYLWRGLAVIAVEDVAFGDPDAVTFTTAATTKTVRAAVGDDLGLAVGLIRRMCAAPKSRACCELSIAVEMGRPDLVRAMSGTPDGELLDIIGAGSAAKTHMALGVVRGVFPGVCARDPRTRVAAEETIAGQIEDPRLRRATIHALRRPVDSMSVALGPVARISAAEPSSLVDERDRWPKSQIIKGLQAEAFDVHTRTGKAALAAAYRTLSSQHPWLERIGGWGATRTLGAAVFLEEGGLLDRRLTGPILETIREAQDTAYLTTSGAPAALHEPLRTLIARSIDVLHVARSRSVVPSRLQGRQH